MIDESEKLKQMKELRKEFYTQFDTLQQMIPVLSDEAYEMFESNLREEYKSQYKLLYDEYRIRTEREFARLQALHDRLVPFSWETKILHKHKQNYAQTLVEKDADEETEEFFSLLEAEIEVKRLELSPTYSDGEQSESAEKWEVVGELAEDPADGAEQPGNGAEAEDPAEGAESEFEVVSDVPEPISEEADQSALKEPKKGANPSKEKKAGKKSSKNASVSDSDGEELKKDEEKAEAPAENAPESVFEAVQEGKNPPKRSRRKKSKKGEEKNAVCESDQT